MIELRWVEVSDMEFESIGGAFVECKRSRWLESVPVKLQYRAIFNIDDLHREYSEWIDVKMETEE